MEYYRLRGTLNPNRKIEWAAALITMMVNNVNGGKATMKDFMPYKDEEEDISLEDAMRLWN